MEPDSARVAGCRNQALRCRWRLRHIHYFSEVVVGKMRWSAARLHRRRGRYRAHPSNGGDKFPLGLIPSPSSQADNKLKALGFEWDYDAIKWEASQSARVLPSSKAVYQGYYIPFARPLFLYINAKIARKAIREDFVKFFLHERGGILRKSVTCPFQQIAYKYRDYGYRRKKCRHALRGRTSHGHRDARSFYLTAAVMER